MDEARRAELEAKGFAVGDVPDLLMMDDEERAELADHRAMRTAERQDSEATRALEEFRRELSRGVKRCRKAAKLSQIALAERAGTTQGRISAIEREADGIGLDLLMRAFFATGGRVSLDQTR